MLNMLRRFFSKRSQLLGIVAGIIFLSGISMIIMFLF